MEFSESASKRFILNNYHKNIIVPIDLNLNILVYLT